MTDEFNTQCDSRLDIEVRPYHHTMPRPVVFLGQGSRVVLFYADEWPEVRAWIDAAVASAGTSAGTSADGATT